jgi:hypothetical protein
MTIEEARLRSKNHLNNLETSFRTRAFQWYDKMKNIPLLIYCSLRTPEEQDALYAQGRMAGHPGAKVTNAKGTPVMQSLHGYGKAYDWVPIRRVGETDEFVTDWENEELYKHGQKVADGLSIRHLTWETPHLEDGLVSGWRECSLGGATDGNLAHPDNHPDKISKKKKFFINKSR